MGFKLQGIKELYHGSPVQVAHPDVYFSGTRNDFGRGFYLFPNREDAYDWALIKKRRTGSDEAFVSRYGLRLSATNLSYYSFDSNDADDLLNWIKFVVFNRDYTNIIAANPLGEGVFDMIIGPVANNKLAEAFNLLVTGRIPGRSLDEVLMNFLPYIKYERLDNQICIKTKQGEKALEYFRAEKCW